MGILVRGEHANYLKCLVVGYQSLLTDTGYAASDWYLFVLVLLQLRRAANEFSTGQCKLTRINFHRRDTCRFDPLERYISELTPRHVRVGDVWWLTQAGRGNGLVQLQPLTED